MSLKSLISQGAISKDSHTLCLEPYHQGFVSCGLGILLCSSRSAGAKQQQQQQQQQHVVLLSTYFAIIYFYKSIFEGLGSLLGLITYYFIFCNSHFP